MNPHRGHSGQSRLGWPIIPGMEVGAVDEMQDELVPGTSKLSYQRTPAEVSPRGMFNSVEPPGSRRFLLAAATAFAGRGYYATTTREIAQLAGSSPAGMYTYFATKADLLYAISIITHEYVLGVMRNGLDVGSKPAERIRGLVKASVAYHAEEHFVVSAVNRDFRALDVGQLADVLKLRREMKRMVVAEVQQGIDESVFRVSHVEGASIALLRMMDVAPWFSERGPMTPTALGDVYADLVLQMLGCEPGTAATERILSPQSLAGADLG